MHKSLDDLLTKLAAADLPDEMLIVEYMLARRSNPVLEKAAQTWLLKEADWLDAGANAATSAVNTVASGVHGLSRAVSGVGATLAGGVANAAHAVTGDNSLAAYAANMGDKRNASYGDFANAMHRTFVNGKAPATDYYNQVNDNLQSRTGAPNALTTAGNYAQVGGEVAAQMAPYMVNPAGLAGASMRAISGGGKIMQAAPAATRTWGQFLKGTSVPGVRTYRQALSPKGFTDTAANWKNVSNLPTAAINKTPGAAATAATIKPYGDSAWHWGNGNNPNQFKLNPVDPDNPDSDPYNPAHQPYMQPAGGGAMSVDDAPGKTIAPMDAGTATKPALPQYRQYSTNDDGSGRTLLSPSEFTGYQQQPKPPLPPSEFVGRESTGAPAKPGYGSNPAVNQPTQAHHVMPAAPAQPAAPANMFTDLMNRWSSMDPQTQAMWTGGAGLGLGGLAMLNGMAGENGLGSMGTLGLLAGGLGLGGMAYNKYSGGQLTGMIGNSIIPHLSKEQLQAVLPMVMGEDKIKEHQARLNSYGGLGRMFGNVGITGESEIQKAFKGYNLTPENERAVLDSIQAYKPRTSNS